MWETNPPSAFDIVTGYFPEANPRPEGAVNRPLLILRTATDKQTGDIACKVAYGTKNLKTLTRGAEDFIVSNISLMNQLGLKYPTRFVLHPESNRMWMPWKRPHFEPWSGYDSPVIGSMDEDSAKEIVWRLASR